LSELDNVLSANTVGNDCSLSILINALKRALD
jgi:hypothetical protein